MKPAIVWPKVTHRNFVLYALASLALALLIVRFAEGIGRVSNLNDGYPWGFWIGMDILAGIALAAGGFVVAGLVHLFGGRRYHALTRPAILTAFLGYLLFITGLMVDLGRPWMIWRVLFHWNHNSPMFEVSWCVTMYTAVLFFEFLPVVFDRFSLERPRALWHRVVPWLIVAMLTLFTFAMSDSVLWTAVVFAILVIWELMMRLEFMPRDKQIPILLVMAGVIFSTLHQSSLGSLLLVIPHKLHPLWWSNLLPVLFFISAVLMGAGMVLFENIVSARLHGRRPDVALLSDFARAVPYVLGAYLILKVADIARMGAAEYIFRFDGPSIAMWLELAIGVFLPLAFFLTPEIRRSERGLVWSSFFMVLGGVINRLNTVVTGVTVPAWQTYHPSWAEVAISLGIISAGIIALDTIVRNFPVYETGHETAR
jgi:formate dehydrogenase iron-sulfur subunit